MKNERNFWLNKKHQQRDLLMDENGLTDSKVVTLNGNIIPPRTRPRSLLYIINGKIILINN